MAGAVSFLLLAALIAFVTLRPRGLPEVVVALPAAVIVVVARLAPWAAVRHELRFLAPTLVFLAAIFVIAEVASVAGVFDAAGAILARRSGGSARRLVLVVAVAATVTTTVLSLDATAVLLTPVVLRVARARHADLETPLLTTTQLANGGSLLLPVSNLTNLIVFPLTGLTFAGFAVRMAFPLAVAVGVITAVAVVRAGGPRGGRVVAGGSTELRADAPVELDGFGRAVACGLGVLLVAFFAGSLVHVAPSVIAAVGAVLFGTAAVAHRRTGVGALVRAAAPGFVVFVGALGVVVTAASRHGLSRIVGDVLPSGNGLAPLIGVALVAAVLANIVNNLPATLVLLGAIPSGAAAPLLAALVGLNVGPNLTYTGSLATLLWRKTVRAADAEPRRRAFFTAAALTTPLAVVAATAALWLSLRVLGGG
ncbi:MAG TPA: SLC13 family permease [Acidimicrobiia bacterium]|nr:SLC13 family permease [Acidimicrobiia bacterium]